MADPTGAASNIDSEAKGAEHVARAEEKTGSELSLKEQLMALDARRSEVRRAVHEALDYLSTTPVGMDGPLVDAEGYPRSDCDLFAVRQARQDVIRGRNDLRAIDDELYEKLNTLHEQHAAEAQAQMARDEAQAAARAAEDAATRAHNAQRDRLAAAPALVRVARVEPTSPAELAGLQAGMEIVQYGELTHETLPTHDDDASHRDALLRAMARVTREHEGQMLSVWVREAATGPAQVPPAPRELLVVPQSWAGSGLLGCGFDPV